MAGIISPVRSTFLRAAIAGRGVLERLDRLSARIGPKDTPGLLIFVVHSLFSSSEEVMGGALDPHERATPEGIKQLISYFRSHGYRFVSAAEIDSGLEPGGLYAHLSFDDGFANNLRLIDLLASEEVAATLFPAVDHICTGRVFWWNALYRERHRRGQLGRLAVEVDMLRSMTAPAVDSYLISEFGPNALAPLGDTDRPLTVEELRELAASPWVEIGNHTMSHAILTNDSEEEARDQVVRAQAWLRRELGATPMAIAYPNGSFDDRVVSIAEEAGLRLGFTTFSGLNPLPVSASAKMRLRRFRIVFDNHETGRMLAVRGRIQLAATARQMVLGVKAGRKVGHFSRLKSGPPVSSRVPALDGLDPACGDEPVGRGGAGGSAQSPGGGGVPRSLSLSR